MMGVLPSAWIFTFCLTLHMRTTSLLPRCPCCPVLSAQVAFPEHLTAIWPLVSRSNARVVTVELCLQVVWM